MLSYIYNVNITNELKKFQEAIHLSEFFEMDEIVQIKKAKEYLEDLKKKMQKHSSGLEISIYKGERHLNNNIKKYQKYLLLIDEKGLKTHLDKQELAEFFEFLRNSPLEKRVIYELIIEFSKSNIDYYQNLKILEATKVAKTTKDNSRRVKQKIQRNNIVKSEFVPVEENSVLPPIPLYFTNEELEIINKINNVIVELEKDNELHQKDALSELLEGDYELSTREKIYSSNQNIWNTILNDLKYNLIPNINQQKDKIIKIYRFVIDKYEQEYVVAKEKENIVPFTSNIADFSEEEEKEIQTYIELAEIELNYYDNLPITEKNLIRSIEELLKGNEIQNLNDLQADYSQAYVECLNYFRILKEKYNDYKEWRNYEEEFVKEGSNCDVLITDLMTEIRNTIVLLKETYNILMQERYKEQETENITNNYDNQQRKKNLILFLPSQNGEYYIQKEQESILSTSKETMKDVASIIKQIFALDFEEYKKAKVKQIKKLKCNKNYIEEELNPHRIRRNEARVVYITPSITSKNKKILQENFDLNDNFRILLFVGVGNKESSDDEAYRYFNSQLEVGLNTIRQIKSILGNDFTNDTYAFIEKITADSIDICNHIIAEPYTIIPTAHRGSRGVV